MTAQTFSGYWWRVEAPSDQQPGTLTIASDGSVTLELIKGFDQRKRTPHPNGGGVSITSGQSRIDVIHGVTTTGQEITLVDCLIKHQNLAMVVPTQQRISAHAALIGLHLDSADDEAFETCYLRIENLRSWMAIGEYDIVIHENKRDKSATVRAPEPVSVQFEDFTITAEMHTSPFNYSGTRDGAEFTSETIVTLSITSATARSHRGFHEITMALVDLLTLASNRPCGIISQNLVCVDREQYSVPELDEHTHQIRSATKERKVTASVHTRRTVTAAPTEKELQHHDFLFTCSDNPFDQLVGKWLELRKQVRFATNMLFSLQYSRPTFIQTQLLVAAVAAEAMSRCLRPDAKPMMPRDFDRMVQKVLRALEGIDQADRERFHRLIRNEPNYRDRLIDIASMPPQEVVEKVIPDIGMWADELKEARHGLAHALQGRGTDVNLFLLLQRTLYLIYLVLMTELGLSEAVQMRAVEDNQYLSYLYKEQD